MNEPQRHEVMAWAFLVLFVAFASWFLFSLTPAGHAVERAVTAVLPRWYVAGNLVLVPLLAALTAASRLSFDVRLVLAALMLVCLVVAVSAARVFVGAYCAMLAVLLVEAYWVIPKWNARHRRGR